MSSGRGLLLLGECSHAGMKMCQSHYSTGIVASLSEHTALFVHFGIATTDLQLLFANGRVGGSFAGVRFARLDPEGHLATRTMSLSGVAYHVFEGNDSSDGEMATGQRRRSIHTRGACEEMLAIRTCPRLRCPARWDNVPGVAS